MATTVDDGDFTTLFFEDFNDGSLDRGRWHTLFGGGSTSGAFTWDPGQLELGNGLLTIATEYENGGWVSGGLSSLPDGQTYGRYEFSAQVDPGQGTAAIALLWPTSNQWTDEINILETHRPDRSEFAFTNHGTPWETQYIPVDASGWHTYALDWAPDLLRLSVDGQVVATMTHDIPDQPMAIGFQGHVNSDGEWWAGGPPDRSSPDRMEFNIDWVKVSAYTPDAGGGGGWEAPAAGGGGDDGTGGEGGGAGGWDLGGGEIDWEALAAQVLANFEATGTWYI